MRLIIAGGREVQAGYADDLVKDAFDSLDWSDQVTEIVHGAANGIDGAAERVFADRLVVTVMRANWSKFGKAAGPVRNRQMAEYADALLAIWDGKSRGTKNMIETARKLGLRIEIYRYTPL